MLGANFSDDASGDIAAGEGGEGVICEFRSDGGEEAAGSLRIEEQRAKFIRHLAREGDAAFGEFAIIFHACGEEASAGCGDGAREIFNARVINFQRHAAADGHFARVAEKPEAGHVCDAVDWIGFRRRAIFDFVEGLGGVAI